MTSLRGSSPPPTGHSRTPDRASDGRCGGRGSGRGELLPAADRPAAIRRPWASCVTTNRRICRIGRLTSTTQPDSAYERYGGARHPCAGPDRRPWSAVRHPQRGVRLREGCLCRAPPADLLRRLHADAGPRWGAAQPCPTGGRSVETGSAPESPQLGGHGLPVGLAPGGLHHQPSEEAGELVVAFAESGPLVGVPDHRLAHRGRQ